MKATGVSVFIVIYLTIGWAGVEALPPDCGGWENSPLVKTKYGYLKGFADKESTWCWKGIPYAAPPVGQLRWKAPLEPEPWTGIRSAKKFGSSAAQVLPVLGHIGSEDCLYLNIWRPKGQETKLPVYLFIHGGGNSIGTSASRDYYGTAVAGKSKLLFVTVNYRLGVLGWFRHPAVTGTGSQADQSGNFGTLDLIRALKWVRENIEAFGGDPGNVTISGESAGALNVLSLLTSPAAKGLFHKAVVESGLAFMRTRTESERSSRKLLEDLLIGDGKAKDQDGAKSLVERMTPGEIDVYLRSKTPAELMGRVPSMDVPMADWPAILKDGTILPVVGYDVFRSGTWPNQVPILIGVNKDEAKLFRFMLKDPEPGSGNYEILSRYQSLVWRVGGLDTVARAITSHPHAPPVYAYRFDWGSPYADGISILPGNRGQTLGAHHYAEIPFFLGTGSSSLSVITRRTFTRKNQPGREKLTTLCMHYLENFARTGNPNGSGLPTWEQWNPAPGADKFIILDAGFRDLRISSSQEDLTTHSINKMAESELEGAQLEQVLRIIRRRSVIGR